MANAWTILLGAAMVSVAWAGCLENDDQTPLVTTCQSSDSSEYEVRVPPIIEGQDSWDAVQAATQRDPRQSWDTVSWLRAPDAMVDSNFTTPDGWEGSLERLGGENVSLWRFRMEPGANPSAVGNDRASITWANLTGDVACPWRHDVAFGLDSAEEGRLAQPGMGVQVLTAGFFPNGTLFYTNIEAFETDAADWPRIGWYAYENGDPLPVYVYNNNRDEKGPEWGVTPLAGTGAPVVENIGWTYFTTIQGFNEALKGLSDNTTRVAYLDAEDAYTLPGYEDHPLYGEDLVFLIKIVEVNERPCIFPTGERGTVREGMVNSCFLLR